MRVKIYALSRDLIVDGEYQPFRRTTRDEPGQSEYFFIGKIQDAHTKQILELSCPRHKEVVVRACLDQIYTDRELSEEMYAIEQHEFNQRNQI